jgi:TolB protein
LKTRIERRSFVAALMLAPFSRLLGQERGQIVGGVTANGGLSKIRIAVPEFQFVAGAVDSTGKLAAVFNETLWSDLNFSGALELLPRSSYPLGTFTRAADIKSEDWIKPPVSAQYVVYGQLGLGASQIILSGFMRELASGQDPVGSAFNDSRDEAGARIVAHRFADRILERLGVGKGSMNRTQIAFVSTRTGSKEIWVMDYDGNGPRKLTAIGEVAITPRWSPVDDRIAFTTMRGGGAPARIEILSSSGQRHPFQQPLGVTNSVPAWAPDGKSIAFSSNRAGGSAQIYIADADGTDAKQLTHSPQANTSPSISPTTGEIAFISGRSGTPELYIMDKDGTNVRRITDQGGEVANPDYSPDGTMIAFAWQKPRSGGFDLYLYNVGMRNFTQLTSDSRSNERPTWAPDGIHIAYSSKKSGTKQIYSMTLNGQNVRQLTTGPGENEGPSWSGFPAR